MRDSLNTAREDMSLELTESKLLYIQRPLQDYAV